MAEEDDSQKTEEPTSKKLSKAKQKGQTASSQEIKAWAMLLGGGLGLMVLIPFMSSRIFDAGRWVIAECHGISLDPMNARELLIEVTIYVGITLAPVAGIFMLIAVIGSVGQSGWIFAPSKIKLDIQKISLIKGLKSKISFRQLVEFVKGIVKLVVVAGVALGLVVPFLDDIAVLPLTQLIITLQRLLWIAIWILGAAVGVMTVIAFIDYLFQKYQFIKQMRMTKQEVKDEHKESEGDPQIKAQIRRLRVQRARQRMMAAVPHADVVITNPTHFAVALKYDMEKMPAPMLVAKGVDSLALRIRAVAEENEVPIVENPPLARALYASVELEEHIPPEHYKAVAEIIGYVMRLRGDLPPAR